MKKSVRDTHSKAKKLLRLYSRWQETRRSATQQQCLSLLGEILAVDPNFKLRREFDRAF